MADVADVTDVADVADAGCRTEVPMPAEAADAVPMWESGNGADVDLQFVLGRADALLRMRVCYNNTVAPYDKEDP